MKNLFAFFTFTFFFLNLVHGQTAEEFFNKKDYHNAAIRYEIEVASNPAGYLNLGKSYFALKEYDKAVDAYKNYKEKFVSADKDYINKLIELLEREDDYVEVVNVGSVINSGIAEAVPRISQDGKILYFKSVNRTGGVGGEDIWYSTKQPDGNWGEPIQFKDLNTTSSEALYSIGGGQNVAILFGNYKGTFGNGDLFYSVKTATGWTMPCNLGATINSKKWESQACLAPDGKTLFFCSNRSGGQGGDDIYVTVLSENGWSQPENLGSVINTDKGEYRPTMAADGKTLYFASHGHFGFGNSDIFVSRKIGPAWQDWSKPVNLGKYINTLESDEDLSLPNSGIRAYTVKINAADGFGDYDIYSFILPPTMRPESVFKVHGRVTNQKDSAISVILRYFDLETGEEKAKSVSSSADGYYEVALPPLKRYQVVVDMKGYLYYTDILDLTNPDSFRKEVTMNEKLSGEMANIKKAKAKFEEYNVDLQKQIDSNSSNIYKGFKEYEHLANLYRINAKNLDFAIKRAKLAWLSEEDLNLDIEQDHRLTTIQVGASFELKNIFFDFGKATLTEASKTELNKLVDIMKRSDIIIELGGHSDDVGSAESNKSLSQERVNSVRDYMVASGIESSRIAAMGYGEERPIASNDTEEGRQKNRRVDVQITDIKPREGAEVVTAGDLKKENQEDELSGFDFLSTLQYAARKGGLPDDSPCANGVSYLYAGNNEPAAMKTQKTKKPKASYTLDKSNYIYKSFNAHFLNYGYKNYGTMMGVGVNILARDLAEYHGEYYFMGPDSMKRQAGIGLLFPVKFDDIFNIPLSFHYGVDFNLLWAADKLNGEDGWAFFNFPVGLRYSHNISDGFVVGPEFLYYFGHKIKSFDTKSKYIHFGVNGRWKMFQGGLFFNKGDFVDYMGFRAGIAL
ncbi:MAG: OmpA family protein [Bacteroidales bacterium]|nr:OmpA family protein [Bacteroidales bacterium]MCF8454992.1 OmpA family protein [Bacteroidales bacterium]